MRDGCPFCDYEGPSEVLMRGMDAYVIEPMNPVVPGHVIVVASDHVVDFTDDALVTRDVMMYAAVYARRHVDGDCNLITSKGSAATQSVPHFHVHLVPRSPGDGLKLPWSAQSTKPPPTHICNACGKRIEYGAHAHGCPGG